jgi:hypothetical protein
VPAKRGGSARSRPVFRTISAHAADAAGSGTGCVVARCNARSRRSDQIAGITSSVSTVLLTIPPIIGAAMRFMTLAPVPVPHRIGSSPIIVDATVIIFGRTRSTAPSITAAYSSAVVARPARTRSAQAWSR